MAEYHISSDLINLNLLFKNTSTVFLQNDMGIFRTQRNEYIKEMIHSMIVDTRKWEENTKITQEFIGKAFSATLKEIARLTDSKKEVEESFWDELFSYLLRFALELYLSNANVIEFDVGDVRNFAAKNLDLFSSDARLNVIYSLHSLPITILKGMINDTEFKNLEQFSNSIKLARESMEKSITDTKDNTLKIEAELDKRLEGYRTEIIEKEKLWKFYIESRQVEADKLKNALDSYRDAFNFVGLRKGFEELSAKKKDEKKHSFWILLAMGVLVLVPFLYEVIKVSFRNETFSNLYELIPLIPVVSLALIFIYYFKIALHNYNSLKSQILQIELRMTLCQFIQSYGEYATKMKKEDPESLSKFENVVFANITSENNITASAFDGIEQLSKLISSVKNK